MGEGEWTSSILSFFGPFLGIVAAKKFQLQRAHQSVVFQYAQDLKQVGTLIIPIDADVIQKLRKNLIECEHTVEPLVVD